MLFLTGNLIIFKGFRTPEQAAKFDRNAKYTSSTTISLAMTIAAFCGFAKTHTRWGCWTLLFLGLVSLVDTVVAIYVIVLDEIMRDHYLSRERPDEFNIDIGMDEADPFNENEETHMNPRVQSTTKSMSMKDQRVKQQVWQKIEDDYGLSPIAAFKTDKHDHQSGAKHEDDGDNLL